MFLLAETQGQLTGKDLGYNIYLFFGGFGWIRTNETTALQAAALNQTRQRSHMATGRSILSFVFATTPENNPFFDTISLFTNCTIRDPIWCEV